MHGAEYVMGMVEGLGGHQSPRSREKKFPETCAESIEEIAALKKGRERHSMVGSLCKELETREDLVPLESYIASYGVSYEGGLRGTQSSGSFNLNYDML